MTSVFIISAPSGSGKSTLVGHLMQRVQNLRFSVSYTTRQPRGQEKDGTEYYFISRDQFEARIFRKEFLEYADVFGNYYGTHESELIKARNEGYDLILDIDVKGARQLRERVPEAISIFILPPSRKVLEQRLRSRSQDSEVVIARRLMEAVDEIRDYSQYDYVLVNEDVDASVENLVAIVNANRSRRKWMEEKIHHILETFEDGRNES
jgi:guanylate kinase